jgi:acyl-CoA dehydrogenase
MRRTLFEDVHEDFRESARTFLMREAVPRREQWEEDGIIDREFWRKAAAGGFVGFPAPEEFGGAGVRDFRFNAALDEEVVGTGAVGDGFTMCNDIVPTCSTSRRVSSRSAGSRASCPATPSSRSR